MPNKKIIPIITIAAGVGALIYFLTRKKAINLFPNPGAEEWINTEGSIDNSVGTVVKGISETPMSWIFIAEIGAIGTVSQSAESYQGNYSVRYINEAGNVHGGAGTGDYGIPLEAGKTYEISAYVKTTNPDLYLFAQRADTWEMIGKSYHTGSGKWEKLSVIFPVEEDIPEGWIFHTLSWNPCEWLVDKVELKEVGG